VQGRGRQSGGLGGQAVVEIGDGRLQRFGQFPQTGGGQAVGAAFVFLDLLKADAHAIAQLLLGQTQKTATSAQATAQVQVDFGGHDPNPIIKAVPVRHVTSESSQTPCRFRLRGEEASGTQPGSPTRINGQGGQPFQEGRKMGGFGIIAWIIIGIVAGWLAEKIMKRDHGLVTNLIVGVIGALIGGFLANNLLGVDAAGNWIVGILVATIGAVVLLFLLGLVKRRA